MTSLIAKGAQIGITAFFAVLVFVLCFGVIAILLALITRLFGYNDDEHQGE